MNLKQINHELKKAKSNLAFWIDHKNTRVMGNDGGMMVGIKSSFSSLRKSVKTNTTIGLTTAVSNMNTSPAIIATE